VVQELRGKRWRSDQKDLSLALLFPGSRILENVTGTFHLFCLSQIVLSIPCFRTFAHSFSLSHTLLFHSGHVIVVDHGEEKHNEDAGGEPNEKLDKVGATTNIV